MKPSSPALSVIVPYFNEEQVIEHTHERLAAALAPITADHEIIYVDDGSLDRTAELLHTIQRSSTRGKVVRLSRNFGHQIAVSAGLGYASGDAVVLIDRLSEVPIPLDTGDFRLMDRSVVTALSRMREKHRMLRAMTAWVGFRQIAMPYSRAERSKTISRPGT